MINIWEYANTHPRIRLVDKKGKQYIGQTLMVFDALEADDEWDSIHIELDSGGIVGFYPQDIYSIEVLE